MRRLVSIFMMCCLLLGIFPTTALAAKDSPGNEVTVNLYRSRPSAAADYTVELKGDSTMLRKPWRHLPLTQESTNPS